MNATLESTFGFQSRAFQTYMGYANTRETTPSQLSHLSSEMAAYAHPVTIFAGGWAAAEAAMYRFPLRKNEHHYSTQDRLEALENARKLWHDAASLLGQERHSAASPEKAAEFLSFELLTLSALAHMPSMQLIAKWRSYAKPPEHQTIDSTRETKRNVLELGTVALGLTTQTGKALSVKKGFCYRITTSLLIQNDTNAVIPASMRQQYNIAPRAGDIIAVSANDPSYASRLLRVTHTKERYPGAPRLSIIPKNDLVFDGLTPLDTLKALVGKPDSATSEKLSSLSSSLLERLSQFDAGVKSRI